MTDAPGPLQRWVLAARPRTLPAAVVPVVVGAVSVTPREISVRMTMLAAVVALSLQIGTNFANDYSDGVRGTDEVRVGPFRLTASKLVSAHSVRTMAFAWFGVAAAAGLVLAASRSWWLVPVGVSAVAAGWFYTGGPKPYGYYGFGELFVMLYFGFVATVGTVFLQHRDTPASSWWLGLATGSMACALLEANNLRDVAGDQASGKKTLAARLGRRRAAWLYALCVAGMALGFGMVHPLFALFALAYVSPMRLAFSDREGRDLLPLLQKSAKAQLAVGLAVTVLLALNV